MAGNKTEVGIRGVESYVTVRGNVRFLGGERVSSCRSANGDKYLFH